MKNKKILLVLAIVVLATLLCTLFIGCTKKNENILSNDKGVFKFASLTELKNGGWILGKPDSVSSESSVFTMNADADANEYSVTINTTDSGWATLGQKVQLTAGQYYLITYSVSISKMAAYTSGTNFDGVYVTFAEDEDFNYNLSGEDTDISTSALMQTETGTGTYKVGFKAKSGGEATILLKVGTKEHMASANVTVNNFTLARVSKADLVESNNAGSYETDYYGLYNDINIFYIVFGAFLVVILCYMGYFLYQRHLYFSLPDGNGYTGILKKISESKYLGVLLVICLAVVIRLVTDILSTVIAAGYTHTVMGYNLESLTTQAMFLGKYGTKDFFAYLSEYASENAYTYSAPGSSALQLYFLALCGAIGRIFSGTGTYFATMFFIRFFCLLADIGTAVIIYMLVKKSTGNVGALIIAALYSVLPIVFASSALWGYTESISVFLIALTAYFMLKNNYIVTAVTFFVACMFSMSALFLAPIIVFYTIMQCIIDKKKIVPAIAILVLGFGVFYAINVPFDISVIGSGHAFNCFERAWAELYKTVYTQNAFNFQMLLGNNFGSVSMASMIVSIIFTLFLLALIGVAYFKFKNRMNLLLMGTAFINMMFVFGNNMNPTSMYISLALMLIYAILNKEKRIFFGFVLFATLMFINVAYAELFVSYTQNGIGIIHANAVTYIFSILELLSVLYNLYIVYDIVVTRKVKKIQPMSLGYGAWISNTGKRIKKSYYKLRIKLQRK